MHRLLRILTSTEFGPGVDELVVKMSEAYEIALEGLNDGVRQKKKSEGCEYSAAGISGSPLLAAEWLEGLLASQHLQLNLCIQNPHAFSCAEISEVMAEERSGRADNKTRQGRDKRFLDPAWHKNGYFDFLANTYLQASRIFLAAVETRRFDSASLSRQARFIARQISSALSPANFALTNPRVWKEILESNGECLVTGWQNLQRDIARSPDGVLKVNQCNEEAFTPGKNLATTAGGVVYQNKLMQLIQYHGTTKTVYGNPLLIVPPIVNKFYIFDLEKSNSLVRWLVSNEYTVFMISWVNPDKELGTIDLADYVIDGVCKALEVVRQCAGIQAVNTMGYCTGGTLLAIAQAWLRAQGRDASNSNSFLATQIDFENAGEFAVYASAQMTPVLQDYIGNNGVLDGRLLGAGFDLLRENEYFWPFVIDNYLLGKQPPANSLFYWNNDSSNIPLVALNEYVRATYQDNSLCQSNALHIDNTGINLARIDGPSYFFAARDDHIVPWQSVFKGSFNLNGARRFVLGGSGHVTGVINPAATGKYPHWVNDQPVADAKEWMSGATRVNGSWWIDWNNWLSSHSGNRVAAGDIGSDSFPVMEPAPGSYVKVRN